MNKRIIYIHEVRTSAGSEVVTKAPKTAKSRRSLHVEDELFEMLLNQNEKQEQLKKLLGDEYHDSGYLFTRDNGLPYRVNSITEKFKAFLEKNNLQVLRLHDLRHTFASILYNQGVDILAISQVLGHSDISITSKIYIHNDDKIHKRTVSVISEALKRKN